MLSRVSPQVRNLLLNVSLLSVGVADQLNECVSLVLVCGERTGCVVLLYSSDF